MGKIFLHCYLSQKFQDFLGAKTQNGNPILKKESTQKIKEQEIQLSR